MTMTSSFTNMFNRLPIYTRPKEPAIGYPVLTESTNTNLTGHIIGLDGKPIPAPIIGGNPYNVGYKIATFRGLSDAPSITSTQDDDDEEDLRPPPPLRINTLAYPNSPSSASAKSQTSVNTMNTFRSSNPQRGNVQRKPAPALSGHPAFSLSNKSSTETIRNHPTYEKTTTPEPERNPNRSRGFGLGNIVKEKVASRRKQLDTAPTMDPLEAPSPVAVVKPPNFVSIDDWLDTREREGLHRRSNTITTVASQATRYNEPLRLHLRQSTFAPLPNPHELAPPESVPVLPPIPKQYAHAVPKTSTAPSPPPQPLRTSHPLSPPRTPPRDEAPPRSHIEQLEYEQDQLVIRKSGIKREMWNLQQLLPPNPSTHNPVARKDMNRRLAELVQELADVEKEVHENGMKLHRAWRRRDKKMGFEPTHLWVSRVSGGT